MTIFVIKLFLTTKQCLGLAFVIIFGLYYFNAHLIEENDTFNRVSTPVSTGFGIYRIVI